MSMFQEIHNTCSRILKASTHRDIEEVKMFVHKSTLELFIISAICSISFYLPPGTLRTVGCVIVILLSIRLFFRPALVYIEFKLRNINRSRRIALPYVLADGLNSAERGDFERFAEVIKLRSDQKNLNQDDSMGLVFDCIAMDLISKDPQLRQNLLNMSKQVK